MDEQELFNDSEMTEYNSQPGVQKIQGVDTINTVNTVSSSTDLSLGNTNYQPKTVSQTRTYASAQAEDDAKKQAELDYATGIEHVLDDRETSDYVSTKELYEKTLGVTEYDELRAKLHLKDDESFTDYYNRTHYVPEGFEIQAKLLLAEEKRKKLYAEVEAGKMSEEDFLYEAYGKDLLKQEGVDFESPLYWYQRFKNKEYEDPRDNSTFMLQLIENARTLFQAEKWYEDTATLKLNESLASYVTGQVLPAATVAEIFADQFEELNKYYEDSEKIVKYYRAGLLQGFNPTIDADGDGKIDYYLATDGKLYNVNETGQGANTMKAYYNDDGSLNRIVASDSVIGEVGGSFLKSIGRFFTDVIDFGALAVGAVVDIFDGDGFGDTVAEYQATMGQFWNSTILADKDYLVDTGWKTSDGKANWANIGRQAGSLAGTIATFMATMGIGAAIGGTTSAGAKVAQEGVKKGSKALITKSVNEVTKQGLVKATGSAFSKGAKAVGKTVLNTAVKLTSFANGAASSTSFWARTSSIATLALKDTLQSVATLSINQERLGLSDGEVAGKALLGGAINFAAGMALRSTLDQSAIKHWATVSAKKYAAQEAAGKVVSKAAPTFTQQLLSGTLSKGSKIAVGFASVGMDSLENIISAWTQTSLAQTGEVFSKEALAGLFNNPQFMFNSLFQAYNTLGDEFRITSNKVVGAVTDVVKYEKDFRDFIQTKIKDAAEDPDSVDTLNKVLIDFDNKIKTYSETSTRAEATLKALEDMTIGLNLGDTDLFAKWRQEARDYIKQESLMYTKAVFNHANNCAKAYEDFNTGFFKGQLGKLIWGKDAKNVMKTFEFATARAYLSIGKDPDILKQIELDTYNSVDHWLDMTTKLENYGVEEINEIETKSFAGRVISVINKEGREIFTPENAISLLNEDEQIKFSDIYSYLDNNEKVLVKDGIIFSMKNDGDISDAKESKTNARKYFDVTHNLLMALNGGEETTLFKLSDSTYFLKYSGVGNTQLQLSNIGNYIRAIANVKANVLDSYSEEAIVDAVKTLLLCSYETKTDTENVLKDNIDLVPLLIQELVDKKVLTTIEATKMYTQLKAYLAKDKSEDKVSLRFATDKEPKYKEVENLSQFMQDYEPIKELINKAHNNEEELSDADIKKIRAFSAQYIKTGEDGKIKDTNIIKLAIDSKVIDTPTLNRLGKLSFMEGQVRNKLIPSSERLFKSLTSKNSSELEKPFVKVLQEFLDSEFDTSSVFTRRKGKKVSEIKISKINTFEDFESYLPALKPKETLELVNFFKKKKINDSTIQEFINKNPSLKKRVLDSYYKYRVDTVLGLFETIPEGSFELFIKQNNINVTDAIPYKPTRDFITKIIDSTKEDIVDLAINFHKKNTTTVSDMFANAERDVEKIYRYSEPLENTNTLCITLSELIGKQGQKILNKLNNPDVAERITRKENPDDIIKELFDSNYTKLAEFKHEINTVKQLINRYGTNIKYFNLDDAKDKGEASSILEDLGYNLNGDILYTNGANIIPGVYFNKDTEGLIFKTNSDVILNKLAQHTLREKVLIEGKALLQDPLSHLNTFSNYITYIDDNTEIKVKDIILNSLDVDQMEAIVGKAIELDNIETKRGKNAGALFSYILQSYQARVMASDPDNIKQKQMFVYKAIDIMSKLYDSDNKTLNQPMEFTFPDNPLQRKADKTKMINTLKKLWSVELIEGNKYLLKLKKDFTPEQFKTTAFGLVKKGLTDINYIIPAYGIGLEQHNNITRLGFNPTSITGSYTPAMWFDANVLEYFTPDYVLNTLSNFDGLDPVDLSDTAYKSAVRLINKAKTVGKILELDSSNAFIKMEQDAIRAGKHLSSLLKDALSKYSLTDSEVSKALTILGDKNARENLGVAIRQSYDKMTFTEGILNVTPELIAEIKSNINDLKTTSSDSEYNTYSADGKASVTGSQISTLNPQISSDYSTENIEIVLKLLHLSIDQVFDTKATPIPIQDKLSAMIRTSSTNATSISLKDLYSLSDNELDEALNIMKSLINKDDYKKLEDTIKEIKNSDLHKPREFISLYNKMEQAEKLGPSMGSDRGLIYLDSDINNFVRSQYYENLKTKIKSVKKLSNFIKLSAINTDTYKTNSLMRALSNKLKLTLAPHLGNKGSIMLQNFNISENLYNFKRNILNFASQLKVALNNELEDEAALKVALNYYIYSTGVQQQDLHPEWLFIRKDGTPIDNGIALSGTYDDSNINFLSKIYRDYISGVNNEGKIEWKDGSLYETREDGTVEIKDIYAIKLDRNAMNTTYAESTADIKIYSMRQNEDAIKSMINDRVNYIRDYYNIDIKNTKELTDKVNEYFFKAASVTPTEYQRYIVEKAEGLIDPEAVMELIVDLDSLDFTSGRRTNREENIFNWLRRENNTSYGDRSLMNATVEKIQDIAAHGITKDILHSKEGVTKALTQSKKEIFSKVNSVMDTKENRIALRKYAEAFYKNDTTAMDLYLTKLKSNVGKKGYTLENLAADIIRVYIAESNSVDADIFKLTTGNLKDLNNQRQSNIIKLNTQDGTALSIPEIKNRYKLILDSEVFYSGNKHHVYQVSLLLMDNKGNEIDKVTKYYNDTNVSSIKDLERIYPEFYTKYYKENEGTRGSFNEYLLNRFDTSKDTKFKTLLDQAISNNALLLGYNSANFDIKHLIDSGILDTAKHKALLDNHLDVYNLVRELPTTKNLLQFGGRLKLSEVAKQLGITLDNAHSSDADVKATYDIITEVLNNAIDTNEYQFKLLHDIEYIYKSITKKDLDYTSNGNLLRDDFRVDTTGIDPKTLKAITSRYSNGNRLKQFNALINEINYKKLQDTIKILKKEFRNELYSSRSSNQKAFAASFESANSRKPLTQVMSFLLKDCNDPDSIKKELQHVSNILTNYFPTEDKLISTLISNKHRLLDLFNIDKEEFTSWLNENPGTLETNLKNKLVSSYGRNIAIEEDIKSASTSIMRGIEPIDNYLDKLPLSKSAKQFLQDSLVRLFDFDKSKGYSPATINKTMDLLSHLDQDIVDYILTDPVTNISYESIYRLAQTTVGRKVKPIGKASEYIKNDTIYISKNNFYNLMGIDPNSGVDINTLRKQFGSKEVYIPIIRHPLDKADSIHYFKLEVLEDDPMNNGLDTVINIDTMKSRLNGDVDGDHISILRPTKSLNNYASIINPYKYKANEMLDNSLDKLFNSKKINIGSSKEDLKKLALELDHDIVERITQDLETLNKLKDINVTDKYEELKNNFIQEFTENENYYKLLGLYKESEEEKIKPDAVDKLKKTLEKIYIKPGIDLSSQINIPKDMNRIVFMTDCIGLLNNKLNIQAKRAYTIAQLAYYDVLNYKDTVTGMYQKGLLTQDYSDYKDIDLIDNTIRLSSTTIDVINDNLDALKKTLYKTLDKDTNLGKHKDICLNIITNAKDAVDIETALKIVQIVYQDKNKPEIARAITELKASTEDDAFTKAFRKMTSEEIDGTEFFKLLDDVTSMKKETSGTIFSSTKNTDYLTFIKAITNRSDSRNLIEFDKAANDNRYNFIKKVPVLYMVNDTHIIPEDTGIFLPAAKNYKGVDAAIVDTLSIEDIRYLNDTYNPKEATQPIKPKDYKLLGIPDNAEYTPLFGGIIDNSVIVIKTFDIEKQKTVTAGMNWSKATGSGMLNESDVPEFAKDCVIMRSIKQVSSKKMTSLFDANNMEYKMLKADGTKAENIDECHAIIAIEAVSLLESPSLWDKSYKKTSFEELAYGNNLLSTGGIGFTNGVFFSVDEATNKLTFDNSKYQEMLNKKTSMSMPDRYEHNGIELYQMLQTSTLINHCDLTKFNRMFETNITTKQDAIDYIFTHYDTGSEMRSIVDKLMSISDTSTLNKIESAILSNDLYNRVYGNRATGANTNITMPAKNATSTQHSMKYIQDAKAEGQLFTMDNHISLDKDSYSISVIDLINIINEISGEQRYISRDAARKAEGYNLLLNGAIEGSQVKKYNEFNRTNYKVGEETATPQLASYGSSAITNPRYEMGFDYTTKYSEADKLSKKANSLYDSQGNKRVPVRETYKDKTMKSGNLRLAKLLQAILPNDSGKLRDKEGILASLSPKYQKSYLSITPQAFTYDEKGLLNLTNLRADINGAKTSKVDTEEVMDLILQQQRSPMYWDKRDAYVDKYRDVMEGFITSNDSTRMQDSIEQNNVVQELTAKGIEDTPIMDSVKKAVTDYKNYMPETLEEVVSKQNKFFSGTNMGERKTFKSKPLGLNQGLDLGDGLDLKQDRNIRQVAVDQQQIIQRYSTELVKLNRLCTLNGSEQEINKYAYVLALSNKLQMLEAENKKSRGLKHDANISIAKDNINKLLKDMGISDTATFLKTFERNHKEEVVQLVTTLKSLNMIASQYSNLMGEPSQNIFFLLTPSIKNDYSSREASAKYLISMIANPISQLNDTPTYEGYNLYSSLETSINTIARQAAIYQNSQRLKQDGVIDSVAIQETLYNTLQNKDLYNVISAFDADDSALTQIDIICGRLNDVIQDATMDKDIEILRSKMYPGNNIARDTTIGQLYLELYDIINKYLTPQELSLRDAVEMESSNSSPEIRAIIYAHNQVQDIFAQLSYLSKGKLSESLYNNLINYTKSNNLTLVDKYGRPVDKDLIYKFSENSLEYIAENFHKYSESYEKYIIDKALSGDLFVMDSNLAKVFADKVFVKEVPTKFQKALQKTSSWCIKMLMSSPFKLIDRFLKFTMFDATTLNTANHNTMFKQGEAYTDLRAYFSSKGAVQSKSLKEFLDTQGVSLEGSDFDAIINGNIDAPQSGLFKTYTDKVGNVFTFQTLSQRYAYWLATKESLERGDYSVLGSAYHLKKQMQSSGLSIGEQASFAMAQNLGSVNDFPSLSKKFNKYGFVFTTFPLAAMRWGIGELRSVSSALHDLFTEGSRTSGAKWLLRNSGGIIGTFILEQLLVNLICDMFDVDEEKEDEWKKEGALPNVTQTIIQGQPIMDTFSSMSISRELKEMLIDPFTKKGDEDELSGLEKFIAKNIVSHINPIVKNVGEVALGKDLIDDQVIDTKNKYSMLENLFRKTSSYIIGASGANALVKGLSDSDTTFKSAMLNAINAELGNTKTYKENNKNYYKVLTLLNSYIYKDSLEQSYADSNSFNYDNYNEVKSVIYSLINSEAKPSKVYETITTLLNNGYSLYEVRAALKNCSIQGKLEKISDQEDFFNSMSDSDIQNIKTALAYENSVYPWLDDYVDQLTDEIKSNSLYNDSSIYYNYRPNYNYSKYIPTNYQTYNQNYNSRSNSVDPYMVYSNMLKQQKYQQQQAEYQRRQKQYKENS